MPLTTARRLLAGAAVAGVVLVAGALPATAAPNAIDVDIYLPDITTPAGQSAAKIDPIFFADEDISLYDARIVYKLSGDTEGLSFTSDEESSENCERTAATEFTCTDVSIYASPDGYTAFFNALVQADDSAEIGATATLTATFSAEDVNEVSTTATVTVAEAVDLTAGAPVEVSAAPGGDFTAPVEVGNSSDKTINGAAVLFWSDYAITTTEQYSNCLYYEGILRACEFDQALEPGGRYAGVMPYSLRKDTYAPGREAGETSWMTATEFAEYEKFADTLGYELGSPGDGPEFTLAEAKAQRRAAPQVDPNPEDNWSNVTVNVTGKNGVDLVALGADLRGAKGDVVTTEVGVDNNGPATLDVSRVGDPAAHTKVYVPKGVDVVAAPDDCVGFNSDEDSGEPGDPGYRFYSCFSDPILLTGDKLRYEFGFKITDVASAPGKVTVNEPCECSQFSDDSNKANNTAVLSVNGITGGGDGGTGGGDGEDPPTLPITGPAGLTIAGSGVALLALGAAGFLITRKRRTTFVS